MPPLLTPVLATVYVQLSELAASAAMTLAAAQGSGLDKAARLELANEALAVIAAAHPYLQKFVHLIPTPTLIADRAEGFRNQISW